LDPDQRAREWASTQPYYDTTDLVKAWKLLLAAAPAANGSDGYRYDLCDLGRQVLADLGTRYDRQMIAAYHAKDTNAVRIISGKLLGLIRDLDELTGSRKEFLLGTWLSDARSWGGTTAEKDLCERNARELLTVWTDADSITDYSNRQWNGLLGQFYYHRWDLWLKALNDSLVTGVPIDESAERDQIRDWEIAWTRQHDRFPVKPHGDTLSISRKLFIKYSPDASLTETSSEKQ
jgi:alpha-N-acetylglucosaminidase